MSQNSRPHPVAVNVGNSKSSLATKIRPVLSMARRLPVRGALKIPQRFQCGPDSRTSR